MILRLGQKLPRVALSDKFVSFCMDQLGLFDDFIYYSFAFGQSIYYIFVHPFFFLCIMHRFTAPHVSLLETFQVLYYMEDVV